MADGSNTGPPEDHDVRARTPIGLESPVDSHERGLFMYADAPNAHQMAHGA